ncbi:MAG: UpxY family transcription antiterminator [Proteiniphilum sp.]|jgi:transcription antitermination factor NusG|nr:UpxY family transcription antiterminator [Proteiniphilum sp.]
MVNDSNKETERRWLAAYVKMHHEKKVRDRLTAMGIESFLPVQKEIRQWSDRKKEVERVLISMMIFVKVNREEQQRLLLLPAVLRYMVLRGEHTPTVIPEGQMERFRFMLDYSDSTVSFNACDLQPGEQVIVIKGPLKGLTGELVKVDGKSGIAIRIERLGCATVEMSPGMVEKV